MDAVAARIIAHRTIHPKDRGVFFEEHAAHLRKEFETAVRRMNLPPHEAKCIRDAVDLMEQLYAKLPPRNDGAKPIAHILRVATKLAGRGFGRYNVRNFHMVLAGLLHDSVEDHPETLARLGKRSGQDDHNDALQFVGDTFHVETAHIVAHTSKRKNNEGISHPEKIRAYVAYVERVIMDPRALIVKIADVCDNVNHPSPDPAQRAYSMKKYWCAIAVLLSGVSMHREFIVRTWGWGLFFKLKSDLMSAKRKAAIWQKIGSGQ